MYQLVDTTDADGYYPPVPVDHPCGLGFLLGKVHVGMRSVMDAELAPLDLTIVQFSLLVVAAANPGRSSAELARGFGVSPQAMAALVARSEASGYLDRRPHPVHGRLIECWVTDKGREAIEAARPVVSRVESQLLLGVLSEDERNSLGFILAKVLQGLRASGVCLSGADQPNGADQPSPPAG